MPSPLQHWLIVLLLLVLPVKGAMAGVGLPCHGGPARLASVSHEAAALRDHHGHGSHAAGPVSDVAVGGSISDAAALSAAGADVEGAAGHDGSVMTKASCLVCAAVCGASALPATPRAMLPVAEPAREWRPLALHAPPRRPPGGLERPPRS